MGDQRMKETLLAVAALFAVIVELYLAQDLTQSMAAGVLAHFPK